MEKRESNIIKGIAVIMMLVHHLFNDRKLIKLASFGSDWSKDTVYHASVFFKICVPIFVFISAYGLSKQYVKKDILRDGKTVAKDAFRRYKKLIFGLWAIMAVAVVVSFIVNKHLPQDVYAPKEGDRFVKNLIIDMLGLSKFFETPLYNNTWWYIGFAILLFMLLPLINMLHGRVGALIIPLSLFAAVLLQEFQNTMAVYLSRYILGIAVAVVFARDNIIEKFKETVTSNLVRILFVIAEIGAIVACYYLRSKAIMDYFVMDNLSAIAIIMFICTISDIRILKPLYWVLGMLGAYSMNMFLGHTFIKSYFFKDFTYSFKYWWLISIMLIVISFAVSFALEMCKKGIDKLIKMIKNGRKIQTEQ
ncbi:MAG: acyltransferase [Eubacterium sp.]|nr:acyltransferase [Eubacterium sp.]